MPDADDDGDGLVDEEILNGKDDDDDGLIDEDFGQIGNQMFVLTNYDNTRLSMENFPDHTPMNLRGGPDLVPVGKRPRRRFRRFRLHRSTTSASTDIEKVYVGFFSDSDIGPRGQGGTAGDDMAGSWPPNHGTPGMVRSSDGGLVPLQVGIHVRCRRNGPPGRLLRHRLPGS